MVQEQPIRVERRLSAILAADVAGYSRLMHYDEEATHAKLTALLTEAVHPAIAEHGGRIVKSTGDGFLAEFPSAVEAVRAAVQFQTRIHELAVGHAEDRRIRFRVGVNIGDVIIEPHDIFGDDVNIAARLEGIAEPGGICVSSSVYAHVRDKVAIEFADLGEQNLKNIPRPVRAYAFVWEEPSPATNARNSIRLTTVATLASCWLLPRLSRLQAVHPHLQLTISTTNHAVDFSRDEFDCGIRHGMGLWPGLDSALLFKEILVLAGSPSLLRTITAKHIARSLRSIPIIAAKTRRGDLARWWHGNGLKGSPPRARLVVENRSQALAAAVAGNGLTVIDARFVAAPSLDRLPGYEVPLPEGYYFAAPHRHASRRNIALLRAWLTSEVQLDNWTKTASGKTSV
jgi:class 3 adenylate cyclase